MNEEEIEFEIEDEEEKPVEIPGSFVVKTELKSEEEILREVKEKTSKSINPPTLGRRVMAAGTDLLFVIAMLAIAIILILPSITLPIKEPHWNEVFLSQLSSGLFIEREFENEEGVLISNIYGLSVYFGPHYDSDENITGYWSKENDQQEKDKLLGYEYFPEGIVHQVFAFYEEFLAETEVPADEKVIPTHFSHDGETGYDAVFPPEGFDLFKQKNTDVLVDERYPATTNYGELFTQEWFSYRFLGLPNKDGHTYKDLNPIDYFRYQTNPENPSENYYDRPAIINEKYLGVDAENNPVIVEDKQGEIYDFCKEIANTAVWIFAEFDFYKVPFTKINLIDFWSIFIACTIIMLVFYFMFPMIFKNGETLGKKMFGLVLVTKDGYEIKKLQSVARFVTFYTEMVLGVMTLGLGMVAWILFTAFSKQNRSIHDRVAGTLVIIKDGSVWYKNKEDEEKYNEMIRLEVEKLRAIDPDLDNPRREYID